MNQTAVHSKGRVGIAGAGIIGLTSALLLADAGYEVTVVARNLPGDTSTQWSSPWCVNQHSAGPYLISNYQPGQVRCFRPIQMQHSQKCKRNLSGHSPPWQIKSPRVV